MVTPPDLDTVHGLLRRDMTAIPDHLAAWPTGAGPLADVPLLDPGMVSPKVFTELAGTVRVASATPELITVAGLLEIAGGGVLITAMTLCPHDLAQPPDQDAARRHLAQSGRDAQTVPVEVAVLLSPLEDGGGPVAAVGLVRPLLLAEPGDFPHPEDQTDYDPALVEAAAQAVRDDTEFVADLAGSPLRALDPSLSRVWGPLFSVARAATAGLAARGAGHPADGDGPQEPGDAAPPASD